MGKLFKSLSRNENFIIKGLFVALLVILVTSISTAVYSEKQNSYLYGYYEDGNYGYGYGYSSQIPSAPTGFSCSSASSTSVTCSWSQVTTAVDSTSLDNFSSYKIYYSSTSSSADKTNGTLGATVTSASTLSATVSSLTSGTEYFFAVYAVDDNSNYSAASNLAAATPGTATTSTTGGGGSSAGTSTSGEAGEAGEGEAAEPAGETPSGEPATAPTEAPTVAESVPDRPAAPDLAAEQSALTNYVGLTGGALPSSGAGWSVVHFIAYGTTMEAQEMSPRDRVGVLDDFQDVFGRLPGFGQTTAAASSDQDWVDLSRIMRGQKTVQRNLDQERLGIREFVRIYKRLPVFQTLGDDMAVHYIAYRLRPASRTLASERSAIGTFRGLYGRVPNSAHDWSVMRAIAYSGAMR